jgi:hypothetical protein
MVVPENVHGLQPGVEERPVEGRVDDVLDDDDAVGVVLGEARHVPHGGP